MCYTTKYVPAYARDISGGCEDEGGVKPPRQVLQVCKDKQDFVVLLGDEVIQDTWNDIFR